MNGSPPSTPPLARHAGAIALAAGAFFVVTDLGRYPLLDDRLAMATDPLLMAVNAAYFFAFVGLVFALIALHGRQAGQAGAFGVVAFCAASRDMTQGGNMWFDGFAAPWLAEVRPQAFTAADDADPADRRPAQLRAVRAGLDALRAAPRCGPGSSRSCSRSRSWSAVLLGYNSGLPPYGMPLGLAVAALGCWLIRSDRAASRARTQNSRTGTQDSRA